jgi:hypothetical protein
MNLFNLVIFFCGENLSFCYLTKNPKQHGQGNFLEKFKEIITFLGKKFGNHQDFWGIWANF